MFGTLIGKKKMTEVTLAKVLVSGTLRSCEPIFKELVEYIKECPHFETEPQLKDDAELDFIITVFTCNITRIPHYMDHGRDKRIAQKVLSQLSESIEMDLRELGKRIQSCKSLMKRLNHPSKNLVYAMPKALFDYYELNEHQQAYFRDLRSPNPLYLKEMNQLLDHVVWDWDFLKNEYKFVE